MTPPATSAKLRSEGSQHLAAHQFLQEQTNPRRHTPAGVSSLYMELPSFDTRTPTNPLFGPLSIWLCGDSPWDDEERPKSMYDLADRLSVDYVKLVNVRRSKAFRAFHRKTTSNLDEIVERRQEVVNVLYEQAMSGNVTAARTYLQLTHRAEVMAEQGQNGAPQDTMSTDDLKNLTDEEFDAMVASFDSTD